MDIERFLNEQNIRRYRKLLDIAADEIQRRQINNLLADEEEKARELVKPSTRLSQEPCLGVKVSSKRCAGRSASQALVSREMCAE
jgi:hypothetical protein